MNDKLMLEAELSVLEAQIALPEMKANPYHDPKTGKFAGKQGGKKYSMATGGGGGAAAGTAQTATGGGGGAGKVPKKFVPKPSPNGKRGDPNHENLYTNKDIIDGNHVFHTSSAWTPKHAENVIKPKAAPVLEKLGVPANTLYPRPIQFGAKLGSSGVVGAVAGEKAAATFSDWNKKLLGMGAKQRSASGPSGSYNIETNQYELDGMFYHVRYKPMSKQVEITAY